jgi:hypothetical protein
MSQQFPTSIPTYPDTTGGEVLGSAGGGLGLSRILDDYGLDVTAVATKIGTGSSTPSAGKVLRASGAGTSVWDAVNLATDVTGSTPIANGGTGGTTAATARTNLEVSSTSAMLALVYPIGSIYIASVATNPATLLGFGTWVAYGEGKVLVGKAATGTFNTGGTTGGVETVTLTGAQSGTSAHTHGITNGAIPGKAVSTVLNSTSGTYRIVGDTDQFATIANSTAANASEAHTNLQPYIVAYMWNRTA